MLYMPCRGVLKWLFVSNFSSCLGVIQLNSIANPSSDIAINTWIIIIIIIIVIITCLI